MNKLYSNDKTSAIDQLAAECLGVDSFGLMQLAGDAVYQHVKDFQKLLVVTGPGNNGGDGFVIAELARQQGQTVGVLTLCDVMELEGCARLAAEQYQGDVWTIDEVELIEKSVFDVVVDAVFGAGLNRVVAQPYRGVLEWLNQMPVPIIAVDIPSGLNGNTGKVEGIAVKALKTIVILARKTGLFTLAGKDCCGEILYEGLGVPESAYHEIQSDGLLLSTRMLQQITQNRSHNSHKGQYGHVITAGGQSGMLGAVLLAGKAVLKAGAGSTTVVTDSSHANLVPLYAPEIMSESYAEQSGSLVLFKTLEKKAADVLLLGMGLGQSTWSKKLFKSCVETNLPLILDADGLNLLSRSPVVPTQLKVITPHPKEAAVLLNSTVVEIQQDRYQAVKLLALKYNCVAVLKGSGTLIADAENVWCCPYGSANLATAGSGDVLAGLIAGLMAQGLAVKKAVQLAVIWHAVVGEHSRYGLSMTATDLLETLHEAWGNIS